MLASKMQAVDHALAVAAALVTSSPECLEYAECRQCPRQHDASAFDVEFSMVPASNNTHTPHINLFSFTKTPLHRLSLYTAKHLINSQFTTLSNATKLLSFVMSGSVNCIGNSLQQS